ncbi:CidA/LrgA family protein [Pseudomonas sp. GOM7]|uniref:CidA/LrgA family protein n=1 Tax=unclassified Pseudomonas TaxID=196821 RepID=UPI00227D0E3B|nr:MULTISPECIES: CidA/LrgA family protein [unclassified Pseudomonas]WAJ36149.1 CidA/LrgA family protein [Pseudomonas sp. GOM7]
MTLLRGLFWLVLLQLAGVVLNHWLLPMLPAAIIGLLLLSVWLMWRGSVPEPLQQAAGGLLPFLPLLLAVPASGIMTSGDLLLAELPVIATALVLSLLITVPFCGWLLQTLIRRQERKR